MSLVSMREKAAAEVENHKYVSTKVCRLYSLYS